MAKNDGETPEVKIHKLSNRLRERLGRDRHDNTEGWIDPEAIEAADALIEKLCEGCPEAISGYLEELTRHWSEMQEMQDTPERQMLGQHVFTLAHEIKDIGAMCGYTLAAYFAESLRDYIGQTELDLDAKRVIIQAHIDAMNVTNKQGIKDDAGPAAEELKAMVKVAIEKYS